MKLEIYSFESIQERAMTPFLERTALISIGSPDMASPKLIYKPEHMLRLVFDDITPEDAVERLELSPEYLTHPRALRHVLAKFNTYLFDDILAQKTAKFIMEHASETDVFICQCEHGQSRSAAVAAAIAEVYCGNGDAIFQDKRYSPNLWVYKKLMTAFQNAI